MLAYVPPAPQRIRYKASRTLSRFMDSDAFVRCCVGPVGSGKSSACIMEILTRAMAQAPGPDGKRRTRWAIIRNTFPQLRDTTRKTFEQWIPAALGRWHEQSFTFHIRRGDVDCEILFRALDRPEDVKKLLSLEVTGAYINEAREIPKSVFDVLQTRVGRYPSAAQGGPTWFGVWMDTNAWHVGHWGYKLFSLERPEGFELFEQPGGRTPQAENVKNLPPGYYDRLTRGKDKEWIEEYVDSKYPQSDRGSIYGRLLAELRARGGVGDFDHPTDGVFVSFDLGISDSTAMWFWRLGKGVDFIDHYENSGEPISHYFDVLDQRAKDCGYKYTKLWLPHDGRARTLATGTSIQDEFNKKYGAGLVAIGPNLSLRDGLAAGRTLLEHPHTRFHARCAEGLEALAAYRYEWDEDAKCFTKRPLHNFASHTADSYRYAAVVVKVTELLSRKEEKKAPAPIRAVAPTIDELFADTAPTGRRERV